MASTVKFDTWQNTAGELIADTAAGARLPLSGNAVINGDFGVWQRGTGTTTYTANSYCADRWFLDLGGITSIEVARNTFARDELQALGYGEADTYLSATFTGTTTGATSIGQKIEDVRTLAGQTVTLSFWVKGSSSVANVQARPIRYFGVGGSAIDAAAAAVEYSVSTSWERKSITFDLADLTGETIGSSSYLWIHIARQTTTNSTNLDGVTLSFWGVQLEAGSVATPFRLAGGGSKGAELALCQRYYQRITQNVADRPLAAGFASSSTFVRAIYNLPTTLRTTPSVSVSGTPDAICNGTLTAISATSTPVAVDNGFVCSHQTSGMTTNHAAAVSYGLNEYIEADAEL